MKNPLQLALADYYRSHVYKGMPISTAIKSIKEAIADPSVKEQAAKRLAELSDLDAKCAGNLSLRCYVSHVEKRGLEEALGC